MCLKIFPNSLFSDFEFHLQNVKYYKTQVNQPKHKCFAINIKIWQTYLNNFDPLKNED